MNPPVLGSTSCFSNVMSIPMLNGSNFEEWKEHLLLALALMDLDISLREDRPDDASKQIEETKRWDHSNRISMMIMRIRIPTKYKGIIPEDVTTAKELLAAVEKCYQRHLTTEIRITMAELRWRKNENESVREYLMHKMSVAAKIKKLGMHIPDKVVADMLLDNLPSEYNLLKRTYSRLQDEWSTHELISHCVEEEERYAHELISHCLKEEDRSVLEKKEHDLVAGKFISNNKKRKIL